MTNSSWQQLILCHFGFPDVHPRSHVLSRRRCRHKQSPAQVFPRLNAHQNPHFYKEGRGRRSDWSALQTNRGRRNSTTEGRSGGDLLRANGSWIQLPNLSTCKRRKGVTKLKTPLTSIHCSAHVKVPPRLGRRHEQGRGGRRQAGEKRKWGKSWDLGEGQAVSRQLEPPDRVDKPRSPPASTNHSSSQIRNVCRVLCSCACVWGKRTEKWDFCKPGFIQAGGAL